MVAYGTSVFGPRASVAPLITEQRTVGCRMALPEPSSNLTVASVAVARSAK